MASEPFNSLGGLTVGIPPVPVVNSTGTVVGNVNTDYVLANTVLTNNLRYANGQSYVPIGANTQVIYNSNGAFGSSSNFTFNSTTNFLSIQNLNVSGGTSLGDVANVSILGGLNGYFLQTDGLGQLTWAAGGNGGGGNGNPGGSNTQVQFNNAGEFGGDPGFIYDQTTNILNVQQVNSNFVGNLTGSASNAATAGTVTQGTQSNIIAVGTLVNLAVSGPVEAGSFIGDAGNLSNIPAANLVGSVPLTVHVSANAQPNITSVGNLLALEVVATATAGNLNSSNRISGGNLFITGNVSVGGNISFASANSFVANANVITFNSSNVNFGDAGYLHILGGFNGQVLGTDGQGNLSWINGGGGGGGGTPAGGNTSIQYNNGGIFGGSAFFTYNNTNHSVTINGPLAANSVQLGAGAFSFSKSFVFSAQTSNTTANQQIWAVPAADVSAVDFMIISTDVVGNTRSTLKISSTILNGTIDYNKYAALEINGGIGTFTVDYDSGNVLLPPSLVLRVSPRSANTCYYSMMITQYNELFT